MARIRTIKPEFPHSESMGRVSREARLCFIMLWTLADDSGRLRGNSRMLASLLFPYDDDAPKEIIGWLDELDLEQCICRYQAHGDAYIQITNWLKHQRIDKPSQSKMPEFDESSRILASPRESSLLDQGSRIKDQGMDQGGDSRCEPPTLPSVAPSPDKTLTALSGKPDVTRQAKELLQKLNDATGRNYKPVASNIGMIKGRLAEYSYDDLSEMIDSKVAEWRYDDKMRKYLRPETLFNATKCAQYVGEVGVATVTAKQDWV